MKPIGIVEQEGNERSVVYFCNFDSKETGFIEISNLYILGNDRISYLKNNGIKFFNK